MGDRFFIFGGCGRVNGKAQAFNDLKELDTQDSDEYKWKDLAFANPPPARARHAALAVRGYYAHVCVLQLHANL